MPVDDCFHLNESRNGALRYSVYPISGICYRVSGFEVFDRATNFGASLDWGTAALEIEIAKFARHS